MSNLKGTEETTLLPGVSLRIEYLGMNLAKGGKGLQGELDKILLKISKEPEANRKTSHVNRLEDNTVKVNTTS